MIQKYFFLPNAYENVCSYFMYAEYKKMELKCVCVCSVNKANINGQNMNKTLLLFVK